MGYLEQGSLRFLKLQGVKKFSDFSQNQTEQAQIMSFCLDFEKNTSSHLDTIRFPVITYMYIDKKSE